MSSFGGYRRVYLAAALVIAAGTGSSSWAIGRLDIDTDPVAVGSVMRMTFTSDAKGDVATGFCDGPAVDGGWCHSIGEKLPARCEQMGDGNIDARCAFSSACPAARAEVTGRPVGTVSSWYGARGRGQAWHVKVADKAGYPRYMTAWWTGGPDSPTVIASGTADVAEVGSRLKTWGGTGLAMPVGRLMMDYGSKNMHLGVGACRARVDERYGVLLQGAGFTLSEAWEAGPSGCSVTAKNVTVRLGPGERSAVDVPVTARCAGGATAEVTAYGLGTDGAVAFDYSGLTGNVTVQGRNATSVPTSIVVKPGVTQDLGVKVNVKAAVGTSGGKASGLVIVVVTPV